MVRLLTRHEIEQKLAQAFPPGQVASLVEVLDPIREMEIERASDTRELKQGLIALAEEVRKLSIAQQETARAQQNLAEAQQRTEEHLVELSDAVRGTQEQMAELSRAVGSLVNTFGFSLEEFAAALLPPYLERHYGITDLSLERRYFDLGDGRVEEVDLVGEGIRAGRSVTVLAECRTTVRGREVRRLADKLEAVIETLGEVEAAMVIVAMNIHPTAEEAGAERGVWMIPYSRINRERG